MKDFGIDPLSKYRVEELILYANGIESVKQFSTLSKLEFLFLNRNLIKSVNLDDFSKMKQLILLQLSFNKIETITRTSEDKILPELSSLYLDNNRLTTFNLDIIRDSTKLRYLLLTENKLASLEYTTKPTVMFPNLQRLSIDANNFDCKGAQQLVTDLKKIDYSLGRETRKKGKKLLGDIYCNE